MVTISCAYGITITTVRKTLFHITFGSGIPYLGVSIFDMTTMKNISVVKKCVLSEPRFTFEFKDGSVYLDGKELIYDNGVFSCESIECQ